MPEHSVTEFRGRNKHGHRSVTERKNRWSRQRCPSPSGKVKVGNVQKRYSAAIDRCHRCNLAGSLGSRIDSKIATEKYLRKCAKSDYTVD